MPFAVRPSFVWRLRSHELELGPKTLIMGILNVTPDSFSDGGLFSAPDTAVRRALAMLDEGAHLLDLGGESTRPGATALGAGEEQDRVLPVLSEILRLRPEAILSVDTYHAETARLAVEAGAQIINDVSGHLWDLAMSATCAEMGCGTVLMHTRGRPTEWASLPPLDEAEVVPLVKSGLQERVASALAAGIARERITIDPGFGFGKLGEENFALLADLYRLRELGFPMLAGLSRKRFLAQAAAPLHGELLAFVGQRMHVTLAANVAAILGGAHLLRVHDVSPALEAAAIADAVLAAGSS